MLLRVGVVAEESWFLFQTPFDDLKIPEDLTECFFLFFFSVSLPGEEGLLHFSFSCSMLLFGFDCP